MSRCLVGAITAISLCMQIVRGWGMSRDLRLCVGGACHVIWNPAARLINYRPYYAVACTLIIESHYYKCTELYRNVKPARTRVKMTFY